MATFSEKAAPVIKQFQKKVLDFGNGVRQSLVVCKECSHALFLEHGLGKMGVIECCGRYQPYGHEAIKGTI
jgi:hypothetical protein